MVVHLARNDAATLQIHLLCLVTCQRPDIRTVAYSRKFSIVDGDRLHNPETAVYGDDPAIVENQVGCKFDFHTR